ncbi:MAG: hypothetical protein NTY01_00935, partial [Verrucomicrobia bacterium]|nr:hypothetical protein [Verrucomicrobiota bacterium]
MRTGLLIALALLCAVGARAQQAPDADAAKPTVRIRASELQRHAPNGSNTVVAADAPQPRKLAFQIYARSNTVVAADAPQPAADPAAPLATPPLMLPPPIIAGPRPASTLDPATPSSEPTAPTVIVAPTTTTNAIAATTAADPSAKQTLQQDAPSSNDPIDFEFMNTDIQQVIAFYSQLTHRSAIMQQGLSATITLPHTPVLSIEEAIGAVESVLLINGFAVVPMGEKFFKVVPSPYGPQEGLPVFTEDAKMQQFDRLVAQVVRVKFLDPTDVARALGGSGGGTGAPIQGAPQ